MSEFMSNIVYICIYLKMIIVYNVRGWYQCNIPLVNVIAVQQTVIPQTWSLL